MAIPVGRNAASTWARAVSKSTCMRSKGEYARTLMVNCGSMTAACTENVQATRTITAAILALRTRRWLKSRLVLNMSGDSSFALPADARTEDKTPHTVRGEE